MATQIQSRRGTTAQHSSFTGAIGEITVDTDKDTVVVHDGSTVGGHPSAKEDGSTLTNTTLTTPVVNGTVSGTAIKDEDNMASDSASHLATQQSIKAYVDDNIGTKLDKTQTVLTGSVDTDGFADFISAGTGLNADIAATTDNVIAAFADGYSTTGGNVNYVGAITADASNYWASLNANASNFLYLNRNTGTGAITAGFTNNLPPIYGTSYNKAGGVGQSLNLFAGADAATSCTDENADVTWTFSGNAQIDTAVQILGQNTLLLDGTGDYITSSGLTFHAGENEGGFSIDGWFRLNATGIVQRIFCGTNSPQYYFLFRVNAANVLQLYLGNGSTWSIANGVTGTTTLTTATNYYFKLQWDGAAYKVYLGTSGTASEEISVTSSAAFNNGNGHIRFGAGETGNEPFNGHLALIRYNVGPQTNSAPTVPTAAYKGLAMDGEHWFDLNTFKMKYWDDTAGSWTNTQRVFVGEAITDGASVTSAVTYALKGEYDSGVFTVAASTNYTKNHNIGSRAVIEKSVGIDSQGREGDWATIYNATLHGASITQNYPTYLRLSVHTTNHIFYGPSSSGTATKARIIASRGW